MNKQYHMFNYIASYIQTIYVDRNDTMKLTVLCLIFKRENDLEP